MAASTRTRKTSEPRDRLLRVASGIFYARGIHSVGIDEIVSTAEVTRSTLYRHFPSKEDLVVAYLEAASASERAQVEAALVDQHSPEDALRALASVVAGQIADPLFRGCAFLNAATEFPDRDHPVHQAVLTHRRWYLDVVTAQVAQLTPRPPLRAAEQFVLLRDGAMSSGCLGDPDEAVAVFTEAVEVFLAARRADTEEPPAPSRPPVAPTPEHPRSKAADRRRRVAETL